MKKITKFNFLTSANDALGIAKGCLVTFILLIATALPVAAQNGTYLLDHRNDAVIPISNNGNGTKRTPFLGESNSKVQYLYLKGEFAAAPYFEVSNTSKIIKSIALNVTSTPYAGTTPRHVFNNFKIRIGNTTLTTLGATNVTAFGGNFSTKYTGAIEIDVPPFTIDNTGVITFDLGAGFVWNGTGNIIVEFSTTTPDGTAVDLWMKNGQGYQVEGTEWYASPTNYLARGAYTVQKQLLYGTAGRDIVNTGGGFGTGENLIYMKSADRRFRPNLEVKFDCSSIPNIQGVAVQSSEYNTGGCRRTVLRVDEGSNASGVTYAWIRSVNENLNPAETLPLGNTATYEITQGPVGYYYSRLTTCGGSTRESATHYLAAADINTYNAGTGWSAGEPGPESDSMLNIAAGTSPIISADARACGCNVAEGANLVVAAGQTLQVDGAIKVHSAGSLTIETGASLLQTDPAAANTGNITVRRNSQPMVAYDYTYWSSPVANQNLGAFSPHTLTDKFYSWNSVAQQWALENVSSNFAVGRGYIIRAPQATQPGTTPGASGPAGPYVGQYVFNGIFTGPANNGDKTTAVAKGTGKTSLIGNPYPSILDLTELYNANSESLSGEFLFWTHATAINNNAYTGSDYAIWNKTGAVVPYPGSVQPTGFLAVGQSVMVRGKEGAAAPAVLNFTNDMRREAMTSVNAPFFRPTANLVSDANATNKDRLWLNLKNATSFKQILVGYVAGATNNYDTAYDAVKSESTTIGFYTIADGHELSIQGRSAFNVNDQVIVGFKTATNGEHTIELPQTEGVFGSQQIFLVDKIANVTHNLKEGAYSFNTAAGTFNDRFILKYVGLTSSLGVAENSVEQTTQGFVAYKKANDLVINSSASDIDMIQVYDLSGRMLTQQTGVNAQQLTIANPNWSSQVLIVQMHTVDKLVLTKKVVF